MKLWVYEKWDFITNNLCKHFCHKHNDDEECDTHLAQHKDHHEYKNYKND